ncbi:hypothetical protein JS756_30790 [Streptomyces actuosus]|uniref:AAA+ ATPase domain-containing protein n=1 Tax=Streptomyces actuosus TaxID=1885 RepID=A0ABS2VZG3_STRAS|nr:hypothetical protein [Streptomyces actuosus]MBN0048413.1 hypothetical protein [Streptomyces actuosus]
MTTSAAGPGEVPLPAPFDEATSKRLRQWALDRNRVAEPASEQWEARGRTGAVLSTIIMRPLTENQGGPEKLLVKICPPDSPANEAQRHRAAWEGSPEGFRERHLARLAADPLRLEDGRSLIIQRISRDLRRSPTLSSLPPSQRPDACAELADLVLTGWNPEKLQLRTGVRAGDFLRAEVGDCLAEGRSAMVWLSSLGLDSEVALHTAPHIPSGGPLAPNPHHLLREGSALDRHRIDHLHGRTHGDLHLGNALVPLGPSGVPLWDEILLYDLGGFDATGPMNRDLVSMGLATVTDTVGGLSDAAAHALLEFFLSPNDHDAPQDQFMRPVWEIHRRGTAKAGPEWSMEWHAEYLLTLAARALVHTSYDDAGQRGKLWFLRLAARALQLFMNRPEQVTAAPSGWRRPDAVPAGENAVTGPVRVPVSSPTPTAHQIREASANQRRLLDAREVDGSVHRSQVVRAVLEALRWPVAASGDVPRGSGPPTEWEGHRVVPVRGAPGAGKTVVAGQVYDALAAMPGTSVLVIPCEQITLSPREPGELDAEMGRLLGRDGLLGAIGDLTDSPGDRRVVILDTLDSLLDEHTRDPIIRLCEAVLMAGADLVLTCRRHDFNVLLHGARAGLGRLGAYVCDPVDVPGLTPEEVRGVVKSYLRRRGITPQGGPESFANQVLELTADRRPLREITFNPLLLVMLCQLFADTRSVPRDLTTTRLCAKYCAERIPQSRKYPGDRALAGAKLALWHKAAGLLWSDSTDRLASNVAESALVGGETSWAAFDDLRSEGVLVPRTLDGLRYGFLHQVITEYSIAIHLRDVRPKELRGLLDGLHQDSSHRWFAWQIVRHLVALAGEDDVWELLDQLDLRQVPAYRAAVQGASAEWRPGLLERLAECPASVADLCEAVAAVPDEALAEVVEALAGLGRRAPGQLSGLCDTAGSLAARAPQDVEAALCTWLELIAEFQKPSSRPPEVARSLPDHLLELLLLPIVSRGGVLSEKVLRKARACVPRAGLIGVRAVIQVHLDTPNAEYGRAQLLSLVLAYPEGANKIGTPARNLVDTVRPWACCPGGAESHEAVLAFLEEGPDQAGTLRARAVGQAVNRNPALRSGVLSAFLQDEPRSRRVLISLQDAVAQGGSGWLADKLIHSALPEAPVPLGRLCGLLKNFTGAPAVERRKLADWFAPCLHGHGTAPADAYLRLVHDDLDGLRAVLTAFCRRRVNPGSGSLSVQR